MFVRVKILGIESKFKRGFEKGNMHVVIIIELTTIVSPITTFEFKLVLMFFHIDSIREIRSYLQSWNLVTISFIIVGGKGGRNNKGENQLLIANGKGEFDQNVLVLGNNFKIKYEQLLEAYNGG
jgi:hypothetical protein